MNLPKHLLPTTVVGSYPQPGWLIDRAKLGSKVPRVREPELWRMPAAHLEEAQDDATLVAIGDMERAGIDIITDGEMRRESYSNRFATALEGVDIDNPGKINRSGRSFDGAAHRGPIRRTRPSKFHDLRVPETEIQRDEDHPARPVHHGPAGAGRLLQGRGSACAGVCRRRQ